MSMLQCTTTTITTELTLLSLTPTQATILVTADCRTSLYTGLCMCDQLSVNQAINQSITEML